jgi:hypothetical protein
MVVVADEPEIKTSGKDFEALGAKVGVLKADLAEVDDGVDKLYAAIGNRPVEAQLANAPARALANAFSIRISMMSYAKIGPDTRERGRGRILITGSIVGFVPGTYGRLQRQQGVPRFVLVRAASRAQGHRHRRHLPHAGRDRDRVLRPR